MKWFKHDSDASIDAKLQSLLLDYGAAGYGLYWYCVELIAQKVAPKNITFELEHDARVIARNLNLSVQETQDMMQRMVELGLFDVSINNSIRCVALVKRLDDSARKGMQVTEILSNFELSRKIPKNPEKVRSDIELDKDIDIEEDKDNKKVTVSDKSPTYSNDDLILSQKMWPMILSAAPKTKEPSFDKWADIIRLMRERDNLTHIEIWAVFEWANSNHFWRTNILSPTKLRQQFAKLDAQKRNDNGNYNQPSGQRLSPSAQAATEFIRSRQGS